MDFRSIDDFDVKGKTVLVRSDIEVPTGEKLHGHRKIAEAAVTIRHLSERGAKVVVLGHQGAPGEPDFAPLHKHAIALSEAAKKDVDYLDDAIGSDTLRRIKIMSNGNIALLENLHFLAEETLETTAARHAGAIFVQRLAHAADVFVNDAFALSYLSHASLTGFSALLPSAIGRAAQREIDGLQQLTGGGAPKTFVAGGADNSCIDVIKNVLERRVFDRVITCGAIGELFLAAKGHDLGKPTMDRLKMGSLVKLMPEVEMLLQRYGNSIETPTDCAITVGGSRKEVGVQDLPESEMLQDIGSETAGRYAGVIGDSAAVAVMGSAGSFDSPEFALGTKAVLEAVARKSVSLVFGSDALRAAEKFKMLGKFPHASFAERAIAAYLSGRPLPALEALKLSRKQK